MEAVLKCEIESELIKPWNTIGNYYENIQYNDVFIYSV